MVKCNFIFKIFVFLLILYNMRCLALQHRIFNIPSIQSSKLNSWGCCLAVICRFPLKQSVPPVNSTGWILSHSSSWDYENSSTLGIRVRSSHSDHRQQMSLLQHHQLFESSAVHLFHFVSNWYCGNGSYCNIEFFNFIFPMHISIQLNCLLE